MSQWAPGGRGHRCLAPATPMVVTPLLVPAPFLATSYPVSYGSGPSQYSPQPAHLRHQYTLLSSFFLRHQHSDPYIIIGMTNVLYRFTLVAVVILFDLHILFIVPNIAEARSSLVHMLSHVQYSPLTMIGSLNNGGGVGKINPEITEGSLLGRY